MSDAPNPQTPAENDGGLEARYHVEKINDPNGKHDACRYFVLDPQHDPIAAEALRYYAMRAAHRGLRRDLHDWLDSLAEGRVIPPTPPAPPEPPRVEGSGA